MRVIIKIEVREITFGHAVITWNFFMIFYCCKIASFGLLKVRFEGKKQKDMADDGSFLLDLSVTITIIQKLAQEKINYAINSFPIWAIR